MMNKLACHVIFVCALTAATPAGAVTLLETFDAPSSTANLGAVYPNFNFTSASDNT